MLAFPLVALLLLRYVLDIVAKILKAIRATVQVSIEYILTLEKELVKALIVKDWLGFRRVWELVRVWGALPPSPLTFALF